MGCLPVVIATLNRYEHFKRSIESLQQNTVAADTELFIGVDYPPADKYREGYEKIVTYLENGIEGFKKINLYIHDTNKGPVGNFNFLSEEAFKRFDAYIIMEDDNVFSPNFLEYLNFCAEKYRNDDSIYAICGYSFPIEWDAKKSGAGDALKREDVFMNAYGYVEWKDKRETLFQFKKEDLCAYMKKPGEALRLYRYSKKLFTDAVAVVRGNHYMMLNEQGELNYYDSTISLYMIFKRMAVVMPVISKARNCGYDGSGVNCAEAVEKKNNRITSSNFDYASQVIDDNEHFELKDFSLQELSQRERKLLNNYISTDTITCMKAWAKLLIYWIKGA